MDSIVKAIKAAARAFLEDEKNRKAMAMTLEGGFDLYIEPIDLPGPDYILDPFLRRQIRPLTNTVFAVLIAALGPAF